MHSRASSLVLTALVASACSHPPGPTTPPPPAPDRPTQPVAAPVPVPVAPVAAPLVALPAVVALPGDSNGAYWDATDHALYVVDNAGDQLLRWTDAAGIAPVGAFPPAPKVGLGGVARIGDTWFATSFGYGTDGAVYSLAPAGATSAIPKLAPERRRIGITAAADGSAVYVAYFTVKAHDHRGGVERIDRAGTITDLVTTGLRKAVGVAATATTLYVTDQEQNALYAYAIAADGKLGPATTVASQLTSADLLTLLPNGHLVTGSKSGIVFDVAPSGGAPHEILSGLDQVRGTAYDADAKRLFIVEHVKGGHDQLHVIAYDGGASSP